jgi:hypothetical protein
MDPVDDDDQVLCATYTHARRHPMVLGHIGGWTPPVQLSIPQIAVLIAASWIETLTWRWWGAHLPLSIAVLVAIGVPILAAWMARRVRVEGRSLARAGLGWLTWLSLTGHGRVGGRPRVRGRAVALDRCQVYVAPRPRPRREGAKA